MPFESKLLDMLEDMDDDHYHRKACEEDPKIAYKASLQLIFAHMADFHMSILDCIARRYGHTRDELVETIREAPGWNTMYIHPVLKEFTSNLHLSSRNDVLPPEEEAPAEPVKVVRRRKVKVPEPESQPEPEPESQPTIKKLIRPKLAQAAPEPEAKVIKKKKQVAVRKSENE